MQSRILLRHGTAMTGFLRTSQHTMKFRLLLNAALNARQITHGTARLVQTTQEKQHAIRNLKTAYGTTTEQKELSYKRGLVLNGVRKTMPQHTIQQLMSAVSNAPKIIIGTAPIRHAKLQQGKSNVMACQRMQSGTRFQVLLKHGTAPIGCRKQPTVLVIIVKTVTVLILKQRPLTMRRQALPNAISNVKTFISMKTLNAFHQWNVLHKQLSQHIQGHALIIQTVLCGLKKITVISR